MQTGRKWDYLSGIEYRPAWGSSTDEDPAHDSDSSQNQELPFEGTRHLLRSFWVPLRRCWPLVSTRCEPERGGPGLGAVGADWEQKGQANARQPAPRKLNVGLGGRVSGALTLRASAAARVLLVGAVNGSREARWQEMLLEAGLAHPI